MKWIRWKGIIAFVLIVGIVGVFLKFYAGTVARKVIETAGTQVVGAKVELSHAALSLIPLGMTLKDLRVTDPDEPMTNLFEVANTRFSLEPGPLLLGKVLVDEMRVEGIRIKTPRQTSGELPVSLNKEKEKKQDKADGARSFSIPSFDLPDIKDVLAKESLDVVKEGRNLKKDMEVFRKDVEQRLKDLPDKETFDGYRKRVKDLKPGKLKLGSILGKLDELKAVEKNIKTDIHEIDSLKDDVKSRVGNFKKRIQNLPRLAKDDVTRLKNKYAPTPRGMGNVSALFFGPKTSAWVTRGLSLYQKIQPWLDSEDGPVAAEEKEETVPERGKGVNVPFKETRPMPDFLVKHASLSVDLASGTLKGDVVQATNEQRITGQPLTFSLSSTQLTGIKDLSIRGGVNRVKVGEPVDTLTSSVKGFSLDAMDLGEKSPMGIRISKAVAHGDLDLSVKKQALAGTVSLVLSPVTLAPLGDSGDDRFKKALGKSLAQITALNITGVISGEVSDYHLDLTSNLDQVLKKAVTDMIDALAEDFSRELASKIEEEVQAQVKELSGDLGTFSGYDGELEQRLKLGKDTLKGF